MIDVNKIRAEVSLAQTAQQFGLKLERNGKELKGCCPFHAETTPSFTIYRASRRDSIERYHCFGCGMKGDVVDFVMAIKGVDTYQALEILNGGAAPDNVKPTMRIAEEVEDYYAGIEICLDADLPMIMPRKKLALYNPKTKKTWNIEPTLVHPYSNGGFVIRHDLKDDRKETPMVMPVRLADGTKCWSRFPFPEPRPIYGLERMIEGRQVTIVEGEKCADALYRGTGLPTASWAGGGNAVYMTDWSPLQGKNCLLWPDNDGPGLAAMDKLARILRKGGGTIKMVNLKKVG